MDIEQVLNLFDSFWFGSKIFNSHPFSSYPQNPQPQNPLKSSPPLPEEPFVPRIRTRSVSEDLSSKLSFISSSNSPNSVLFSPKLQTIPSSKDIAEGESPENGRTGIDRRQRVKTEWRNRVGGRRGRGWGSKSMSELEFEELKGFMDLGFVFSEEDKRSSLASIVPGLNRLGKKAEEGDEEEEEEEELESEISRPYLSEAWGGMELKKPLMMNWRFPANEIDMKDNLKWWAHAVASTVR